MSFALKCRGFAPLLVLLTVLSSCVNIHDHKGVENVWRDPAVPKFEKGVTMRAEVLEHLGPPSQVIDQDDGIIFYYMRERAKGGGLFLVLYNTTSLKIDYDRAIFFFDGSGKLVEFAYSKVALPVAKPE